MPISGRNPALGRQDSLDSQTSDQDLSRRASLESSRSSFDAPGLPQLSTSFDQNMDAQSRARWMAKFKRSYWAAPSPDTKSATDAATTAFYSA